MYYKKADGISFSWEGITRNVSYVLQIYEYYDGDSTIIRSGLKKPLFSKKVDNRNEVKIPLEEIRSEEGGTYCWQVIAINSEGEPICSGDCSSELFFFKVRKIDCGISVTKVELECADPIFSNGKYNYKGCIHFSNPSGSTLTFSDPGSGLVLYDLNNSPIAGLKNVDPFPSSLPPARNTKVCFDLSLNVNFLNIQLQIVGDDVDPSPLNECIPKEGITKALPICSCEYCEDNFVVSAGMAARYEANPNGEFDWLNLEGVIQASKPIIRIKAEIVFFRLDPGDKQCILCVKDGRQHAVFVEPSPGNIMYHPNNPNALADFKSVKGEIINTDNSSISRLIQWESKTAAGVDISSGAFMKLGVGIPKLSQLSCCGSSLAACVRVVFIDTECKVCDDLHTTGHF